LFSQKLVVQSKMIFTNNFKKSISVLWGPIFSINGRKNLITYLEIAENFAPKKFFLKLAMIIHKKNHS